MPAEHTDALRRDIEFSETLRGGPLTFRTTWGLFNPKRVDDGSRLLTDCIEAPEDAICLDIGCGYGPIGLVEPDGFEPTTCCVQSSRSTN